MTPSIIIDSFKPKANSRMKTIPMIQTMKLKGKRQVPVLWLCEEVEALSPRPGPWSGHGLKLCTEYL